MVEKQILTNPLGEWRHLVKKFKNLLYFFHFQHEHDAKNRLKKKSLEKKLQLIEI
jgi:hypothetical protein